MAYPDKVDDVDGIPAYIVNAPKFDRQAFLAEFRAFFRCFSLIDIAHNFPLLLPPGWPDLTSQLVALHDVHRAEYPLCGAQRLKLQVPGAARRVPENNKSSGCRSGGGSRYRARNPWPPRPCDVMWLQHLRITYLSASGARFIARHMDYVRRLTLVRPARMPWRAAVGVTGECEDVWRVPAEVGTVGSVRSVTVVQHKDAVPSGVFALEQMVELVIEAPHVTSLPHEAVRLRRLRLLDLTDTAIVRLPAGLMGLVEKNCVTHERCGVLPGQRHADKAGDGSSSRADASSSRGVSSSRGLSSLRGSGRLG